MYDDALRRADVAAAQRFWAGEYVFINPRGERVSRGVRVANLREKSTSLGSLAHSPQEEMIRTYMDENMAVYTTKHSSRVIRGSRNFFGVDEAAIAQLEKHENQATVDECDDPGVWEDFGTHRCPRT